MENRDALLLMVVATQGILTSFLILRKKSLSDQEELQLSTNLLPKEMRIFNTSENTKIHDISEDTFTRRAHLWRMSF